MKYLITLVALQLVTASSPTKQFNLTVNILPALREIMKTQPISIEVSSSDFSLKSSVTIIDSLKLIFELKNAQTILVRIGSPVKYSDSSERYFYFADNFTINSSSASGSITFPKDCEINRYTGGKTCPKCKRRYDVIPIFYGLPAPDLPGQPGIDFEPAGCFRSSCDPSWYCKKDSLQF
jgi:hypothetical protein